MSGSGGGGSVERKQEPWTEVQPFLKDYYAMGKGAFEATPKVPYQGPLGTDPNQEQARATDALAQTGTDLTQFGTQMAQRQYGPGGTPERQAMDAMLRTTGGLNLPSIPGAPSFEPGAAEGTDYWKKAASGGFLDVANNPYFTRGVQAAINPVMDRYAEDILPTISSQAVEQGAYSNERNPLVKGLVGARAIREAGDVAGSLFNTEYGRERGLQESAARGLLDTNRNRNEFDLRAAGLGIEGAKIGQEGKLAEAGLGIKASELIPQLRSSEAAMELLPFELRAQGAKMLGGAGDIKQGRDEEDNLEAYIRWQNEQNAPWTGLDKLGSIYGTSGPQQAVQYGPSRGTRMFGGAAGGAGLGAAAGQTMGGLTAASGMGAWAPWLLGGGVLGGLSGLF